MCYIYSARGFFTLLFYFFFREEIHTAFAAQQQITEITENIDVSLGNAMALVSQRLFTFLDRRDHLSWGGSQSNTANWWAERMGK